jgi:hypothetical protein
MEFQFMNEKEKQRKKEEHSSCEMLNRLVFELLILVAIAMVTFPIETSLLQVLA